MRCFSFVAVACVGSLALAVAAPHSAAVSGAVGGDVAELMAAFVKGHRALLGEYKVATLAVANAILPGFAIDLEVNATISPPNVTDACPNPPVEFPLFIQGQFLAWTQMLHNMVAGLTASGAALGDAMINQGVIDMFMVSRKQFANFPDVNGGTGFGMGFSLLCGTDVVFSFGGGGGGSATQLTSGFGGGAGAGIATPNIQIGGGGGCTCGASLTGCAKCGSDAQQDDSGNLLSMSPTVVNAMNSCPANNITVCFSGGGGGGMSSPSNGCKFGAGFNAYLAMSISGGRIHEDAPRHGHHHQWFRDGKFVGTVGQGDHSLCQAAAPGSGNQIGAVVTQCDAQCAVAPDFNDCFCPCTKNGWLNLGLVWADTITCYNY